MLQDSKHKVYSNSIYCLLLQCSSLRERGSLESGVNEKFYANMQY